MSKFDFILLYVFPSISEKKKKKSQLAQFTQKQKIPNWNTSKRKQF